MNSGIEQALLTVGGSWALSTLAKATLAAALGLLAAAAAVRKSASIRHALLAATLGVLMALPAASALAPWVGIAIQSAKQPAPARAVTPRDGTTFSVAVSGSSTRWPAVDWLTAAWLAGVVALLLPAAAGLREVRRLRRSGVAWPQGQAMAAGRRVEVLLHESLAGPMTCGVVRPAILLPADAPDWDAADLERALMHELAHVERHDWAIHCMARAVCALYWFHPLVWMALRRLELEAERACDDAVLERSEATVYADQLVAVARRLSGIKPPLLAMANRKDLRARVKAVLDGGQRRGRAGRWPIALVGATAAALVVAVAPLRIVAAPQEARLPMLRTETRLVVNEVRVLYPNGKTVEGLTAGDFEVFEDGVPLKVEICEFRKEDGGDAGSGVYLVGYYSGPSKADGEFRKLNIAVKTVTVAKVEHRAGYYVFPTAANAQSAVTSSRSGDGGALPYDRPPAVLFKVEPAYTEEARRLKYQGTVTLDIEVDDRGKVGDVRVLRHLGLGLDQKAIEAVGQWIFRPAVKDGKPIAARAVVEVIFRLL